MSPSGIVNDLQCDAGLKPESQRTCQATDPCIPYVCPPGYLNHNQRCYIPHTTQKETRDNARISCLNDFDYPLELVQIENESEVNYLVSVIPQANTYWIGFSSLTVDVWKWDSGDVSSYTNWETDQPDEEAYNISVYKRNCATMNGLTGTWNDRTCAALYNYICEMDMI
eukprot:UN32990